MSLSEQSRAVLDSHIRHASSYRDGYLAAEESLLVGEDAGPYLKQLIDKAIAAARERGLERRVKMLEEELADLRTWGVIA